LGRSKKNIDEWEEEVNERKILALVMWYIPVLDRLKRMFSSARDAKLIIWHATPDGCKKDGNLRHPADAQ
jgi:hypothetical protein